VVVILALGSFAAPCADWKDGSCESNWASDAQWLLLPVLLLALLVVIWFAVRDNVATLRRSRKSGSCLAPDQGPLWKFGVERTRAPR
jgi:hypothetical protein